MLYFFLLPFYMLLFVGSGSCKKKIYIYIYTYIYIYISTTYFDSQENSLLHS